MVPKRDPAEYTYTKLNDLQEGLKYNVYGVLKEVIKESVPTASGQLHSLYSITDESLPPDEVFRMHCFDRSRTLPKFIVGDIMRFHRVKVEKAWERFDGRVFNATDVVSFSNDPSTNYKFTTVANSIHLTENDKKRISELREVAQLNSLFFNSQDSINGINGTPPTDTPVNNETTTQKPSPSQPHTEDVEKGLRAMPHSSTQNPAAGPSLSGRLLPNPFNKSYENISKKQTPIPSSMQSSKHLSTDETKVKSPPMSKQCQNGQDTAGSVPIVLLTKLEKPNEFKHLSTGETKVKSSPLSKQYQNGQDTGGPVPIVLLTKLEKPNELSKSQSVKKKAKPCPLSKRNPNVEDCPSPPKKLCTTEQTPTGVFAQGANGDECSNVENYVQNSDFLQAESSSTCPGILCAQDKCGGTPVLIGSDASDNPPCDDLGDIPAVNEKGVVLVRNRYNFPVGKNTVYIDGDFMTNFKWPCFSAEVRIIKTKPSLQVLQSNGPKNLLSGVCHVCGSHSFYSKLKWKINRELSTKKPLCPKCSENEICLEMRLQLTLVDTLGKHLKVYVIRDEACKFLGCTSPLEYQISKECRIKTTTLLSNAVSLKQFFTICFYCVNTPTGQLFYVYNTVLSEALKKLVEKLS